MEKSAEAIVVNESPGVFQETQVDEGLNVNLSEIELGVISALRIVFLQFYSPL
jgi:hypothetical protein